MTTTKTNTLAIENRPKTWAKVVGQEIPVKILTQSLAMGEIKPAYLLMGETGSGKTTCALLLAKRLVCEAPDENQEPCNQCRPCSLVDRGICEDVKCVDGASDRSVSFVKEVLKPYLASTPIGGKYRVVIIDEVHQYLKDAISAFLTLLENLPKTHPRSIVIFTTTEGDSVDGAIKNRCLPLNFCPIPPELLAKTLSAQIGVDEAGLLMLAEELGGSFRTVWSVIESWQYAGEELTEETVMKLVQGVPRRERAELLAELGAGNLDKVSARWKKWINAGARPTVIWRGLLKDVADAASKNPGGANWKKYLAVLSGSRPESAMLPALYTMCGLPLDTQLGEKPGPAEGQPTPFVTTPAVTTTTAPPVSLSATTGIKAEGDPLVERLMFLGC